MAEPARRALITGITGQDGVLLAQLLTGKGYEVFGLLRGQANPKVTLVEELAPGVEFVEGDLLDMPSLIRAVEVARPDEVYNLGAVSNSAMSRRQPMLTGSASGLGVVRLLEAIRTAHGLDRMRFVQASSSEMFGDPVASPQSELTAFHPRSPHGIAKTFGHYTTVNYRESYDCHASSAILFNHESPLGQPTLVVRKVARSVARIAAGLDREMSIGNLDACRDWGYAGDYVEAMWRMATAERPGDYVIATGVTHTVRQLLSTAFAEAGIVEWGPFVTVDPRFVRPVERNDLVGDASRAAAALGWKATTTFRELVALMVRAEMRQVSRAKA